MTQELKHLISSKEKCGKDLQLIRMKEESLEPELCKLVFPFGAISDLWEKKGYLLPLRNFQSNFFFFIGD